MLGPFSDQRSFRSAAHALAMRNKNQQRMRLQREKSEGRPIEENDHISYCIEVPMLYPNKFDQHKSREGLPVKIESDANFALLYILMGVLSIILLNIEKLAMSDLVHRGKEIDTVIDGDYFVNPA